jgi:glycine cleavage system H protein
MATYYTEDHEWIHVDGSIGTVGITDFAQNSLGDIVFVELPDVESSLGKGDEFGTVESVKAASEIYAPASGTVIEVNPDLEDDPSLINSSPHSDGWFMKIELSDADELTALMDEATYKEHCDNEDH